MYSAFLLTEKGWHREENLDAVLNHEGDLFINDTKDDQEVNLAFIGSREGKVATLIRNDVVLSDCRVYNKVIDAVAEARVNGEALYASDCLSTFCYVKLPRGRGTWKITPSNVHQPHDGIVAKSENGFSRIIANTELWRECVAQYEKDKRKGELAALRTTPNKRELCCVVNRCAESVGLPYPRDFRVYEFIIWVTVHDAIKGRRATNKLLKVVAKQWCSNRKKSKKWMLNWADEVIVEKTDNRLASVLRIGNKNSWLKTQ